MSKRSKTVDEKEEQLHDPFMFESVAVEANGTLLQLATMNAIELDFDGFQFNQRTGANIMELSKMPWKKIFEKAGVGMSVEAPPAADKKIIFNFLEKELNSWFASRPRAAGALSATVDPAFEKAASKNLHAILKSAGNKMKIDSLTATYAVKTESSLDESSLAHIREQIRLFISKDSEHFAISRGGMANVYRTHDANGKATDVVIETPSSSGAIGSGSAKPVQRYTAKVQEIGLSKIAFEAAKKELGGFPTMDDLRKWHRQ